MTEPVQTAHANAILAGDVLSIELSGDWSITAGTRPVWETVLAGRQPKRVVLRSSGVGQWDSSLLLFLFETQEWCKITGAYCDTKELSEKIRALLNQMSVSHETTVPFDRSHNFVEFLGESTLDVWLKAKVYASFIGECVIGGVRLVKNPKKFRWGDCLEEMQQCGAMAHCCIDRKSTRLNSSHSDRSRMPSSA